MFRAVGFRGLGLGLGLFIMGLRCGGLRVEGSGECCGFGVE